MNIENVLKYQKKDAELYKVEQKIVNSVYRKKATELATIAKKAQARSMELETEAEKLIAEIDEINKNFGVNKTKAEEISSKKLENLSIEDLDKLGSLKSKVVNNLNILEKMSQKSAESINRILSEFNKTKKTYDEARTQYAVCKQKVEEETKVLEAEKQKVAKELSTLEGAVDAKILGEYKRKRNDNIFPVLVPLENGTFCGFCRMEQPKIAISKIKENGVITCEHCKRFIYQ